ncbi:MAG: NAD(P)H-quinone oxidoreductase subunit 5 [Candidatus Endobugula sp.]|jgi:NAD(P)H-quinone oxidoreductase subunit 5
MWANTSFITLSTVLLLLAPMAFLLSALWVRYVSSSPSTIFTIRCGVGGLLLLSLTVTGFVLSADSSQLAQANGLLSLQPLNIIVLSLILLMALIILSFSQRYMQGEACYQRYFTWMLFTLAAVSITIVSNHLILFWSGWVFISLCLHKLLTLYPERPRALLAAHKKFILARTAESLLFSAFVLLYLEYGTFYIGDILAQAQTSLNLPLSWQVHTAMVLIAIAALIKCAQLPVHGWLIKVVEVPTPVSALLHAGVINLGGFILITFAPLFSAAPIAQWLVLIVAGISTLLAALIMTTRISVKVRLAWSTSAQMGMMLVQCALGLYELALLHLVMHSLYKAHQFLSAGNTVIEYGKQRLLVTASGFSSASFLSKVPLAAMAFCWSLVCIVIVMTLLNDQWPLSIVLLLGLAFTGFMAQRPATHHAYGVVSSVIAVAFLVAVYGVAKWGFAAALALPPELSVVPFALADLWVTWLVVVLFISSVLLNQCAHHPRVQRLSSYLFGGLYLDEWFTRWLLAVWPMHMPPLVKNVTTTPFTLSTTSTPLSVNDA